MNRILLAILFSLIFLTNARATTLSDLANSMRPGDWQQLTTTGLGSNPNILFLSGTGVALGSILEYGHKGAYDPVAKKFYYYGVTHHGNIRARFISYDEATNNWTIIGTSAVTTCGAACPNVSVVDPNTGVPIDAHAYDHSTFARGYFFHRGYNSGIIRAYNTATQTWEAASTLPSFLTAIGGNVASVGSLEYFPDWGTNGSLIYYDGDWGMVRYAFSAASGLAGSWTKVIGGCGDVPPQAASGYSNLSAYSPKKQVMIFGGGTASCSSAVQNLYKVTSTGVVTQMAAMPSACPDMSTTDAVPSRGNLIPDPITGNFILLCSQSVAYMYEVDRNVYTPITLNLPFTYNGTSPCCYNISFFPNHQLGVIFFLVAVNENTAQVWLLKPNTDFAQRCSAPGVIRCEGFDTVASISPGNCLATNNCWSVQPYGGITQNAPISIDTSSLRASGGGSARFDVPASTPNGSEIFYNFANNYATQFGANQTFYVSFRQYMGPGYTAIANAGFKQMNLGTGSIGAGSTNSASSCTNLEIVMQTLPAGNGGIMQAYNHCPPTNNWEAPIGGGDFNMQTGRTGLGCKYSMTPAGGGASNGSSQYPPNGNCWKHIENEWISYKIEVHIGPLSGGFWQGSNAKIWAARDGATTWDLVHDWTWGKSTPTQHSAGCVTLPGCTTSPFAPERYGQIHLLPYNNVTWPTNVYTLYDELIISNNDIVVPGGLAAIPSDTQAPTNPANLVATTVSSSQINLTWTASTDTGGSGLSNYHVERCQGAACSNFVTVYTPITNNQNDTGLTGATTYRYRVLATDAAGNSSGYSAIAQATTVAGTTSVTITTNSGADFTVKSSSTTLDGTATGPGF